MPKEDIAKRGRRGGYQESSVNVTFQNGRWVALKHSKPKDLADVDKQRTGKNSIIRTQRKALVGEIIDQEGIRQAKDETDREFRARRKAQEKDATDRVNYQIGSFAGKERPKGFNFSQEGRARLETARKAYSDRKPLDAKSRSLRQGEDVSERKIYDLLRNAKKQGVGSVVIDGRFVKLKDIYQITDKGFDIPSNRSPRNYVRKASDKEAELERYTSKKLKEEKRILTKEIRPYLTNSYKDTKDYSKKKISGISREIVNHQIKKDGYILPGSFRFSEKGNRVLLSAREHDVQIAYLKESRTIAEGKVAYKIAKKQKRKAFKHS